MAITKRLSRVFIDTSVFVGFGYNFSKNEVVAFVKAVAATKLTLLMPDITRREIDKHLQESADSVSLKLRKLERDPVLGTLLPGPLPSPEAVHAKLHSDLALFIQSFKSMLTIKSSTANLVEVVDWYFSAAPPFDAEGKKSEFPDAIVFSSLKSVASTSPIAVVSLDQDFQRACDTQQGFEHFTNLPELTQRLLHQKTVASVRKQLKGSALRAFVAIVSERFADLWFMVKDQTQDEVEDVEVSEVTGEEFTIIDVSGPVIVAFEAAVEWSANVVFGDPDSVFHDSDSDTGYYYAGKVGGEITRTDTVTGTVSFDVNSAGKLLSVTGLDFSRNDIVIDVSDEIFDRVD